MAFVPDNDENMLQSFMRKAREKEDELRENSPVFRGIESFNREATAITMDPLDFFLGGIPSAATEKLFGEEAKEKVFPTPETIPGQLATGGLSVAASILGPGKLAGGVTKKLVGSAAKAKGLRAFFTRRAGDVVTGAGQGFAVPGNLDERTTTAAIGGTAGPVFGAAGEGIKTLGTIFSPKLSQSLVALKRKGAEIGRRFVKAKEARGMEAKSAAFKGGKQVTENIDDLFTSYNDDFGAGFSQIESKATNDSVVKAYELAAKEIGGGEIPNSPAWKLLQRAKKLANLSEEVESAILLPDGSRPASQVIKKALTKQDIQAEFQLIKSSVGGDSRSMAIANKHLLDSIDDTVQGLRALKEAHAPVYNIAKEGHKVNQAALQRVASGNAPPEEIAFLKEAGSGVADDQIAAAEAVAAKSAAANAENSATRAAIREEAERLADEIAAQKELRSKVFGTSKIAGTAAAAGGATFGIVKAIQNQNP